MPKNVRIKIPKRTIIFWPNFLNGITNTSVNGTGNSITTKSKAAPIILIPKTSCIVGKNIETDDHKPPNDKRARKKQKIIKYFSSFELFNCMSDRFIDQHQ